MTLLRTGLRTGRARAARHLLRIANNQIAKTPYGAGCWALAEAISADPLLSASFRPEVYDDGEVGEEVASIHSAMKSTVEIVCSSSGPLSSYVADVGLLDMPFLFPDAATARAVLDGDIGAELIDRLREKGLHVLCWAENGVRQITSYYSKFFNRSRPSAATLMASQIWPPMTIASIFASVKLRQIMSCSSISRSASTCVRSVARNTVPAWLQ